MQRRQNSIFQIFSSQDSINQHTTTKAKDERISRKKYIRQSPFQLVSWINVTFPINFKILVHKLIQQITIDQVVM